jgi:regulator of sigma E protease
MGALDYLRYAGAFVVALGILVAVHEFGHFWAARRVGVRVLRFAIGFGRPLLKYRREPDSTEYVLAAIPLGGYVKMLDEREEEVPEDLKHLAFNRQPLWKRVAVVAAGPAFNLLFAVAATWAIFVTGDTGLKPIVGEVRSGSIAADSGFEPGDLLLTVDRRDSPTWERAAFELMTGSLDRADIAVRVRDASGIERERLIRADRLAGLPEDSNLLERLGLAPERPKLPPVVGGIVPGEAAERAGIQPGDRILAVDGKPMPDWSDWVEAVRSSPERSLRVAVERGGSRREILLTPQAIDDRGTRIGHVGAAPERHDELAEPYRVEVRYGPVSALAHAVADTYDMSRLMLKVMGRILVGQASVKNLSGPIAIAETAGRTASYGLDSFVKFLAVVSISLGVLNLLPVPVLDGGHLLYFLIEWIKGSPLSEQAQMQGQKIGIALIAALMCLAFYSDLSRIFG